MSKPDMSRHTDFMEIARLKTINADLLAVCKEVTRVITRGSVSMGSLEPLRMMAEAAVAKAEPPA